MCDTFPKGFPPSFFSPSLSLPTICWFPNTPACPRHFLQLSTEWEQWLTRARCLAESCRGGWRNSGREKGCAKSKNSKKINKLGFSTPLFAPETICYVHLDCFAHICRFSMKSRIPEISIFRFCIDCSTFVRSMKRARKWKIFKQWQTSPSLTNILSASHQKCSSVFCFEKCGLKFVFAIAHTQNTKLDLLLKG